VISALVVPTLVATLSFAGVASAAAPAVTCKGFGTNSFGLVTLSKCSDTKATGGKGSITGVTTGGTVTWAGTHGTTTFRSTYTTPTKNGCAEIWGALTWAQIDVTVTVTGGTGVAGKSIKKGNKGVSYLCYDAPTNNIKLLKGTFNI